MPSEEDINTVLDLFARVAGCSSEEMRQAFEAEKAGEDKDGRNTLA